MSQLTRNLSTFQTLIRHSIRMLYIDPIIHLLVDFIIDHSVAEVHTFAHRHGKMMIKQVGEALNKLHGHGLLKIREGMRLETFKAEYYDKLLGADKEVFFKENLNKVDLYYFNCDIKFIIKARLYKLEEDFDVQQTK